MAASLFPNLMRSSLSATFFTHYYNQNEKTANQPGHTEYCMASRRDIWHGHCGLTHYSPHYKRSCDDSLITGQFYTLYISFVSLPSFIVRRVYTNEANKAREAVRRNHFHDYPNSKHGKGANPSRTINLRLSVAQVPCPFNRFGSCNGNRHGGMGRRSVSCPLWGVFETFLVCIQVFNLESSKKVRGEKRTILEHVQSEMRILLKNQQDLVRLQRFTNRKPFPRLRTSGSRPVRR
ncbi:hypothetical protein AVEN_140556-1 [Araneus ventricosus]|uniref:Uncharacterized protein n=1 Tax=Araneus ventricosus TaxID=182803 RepID=A0A4Y2IS30_ARAVE|nr:hypothetical protein AVEN_140556-1 [Araneus ventricosus]